MLGTTRSFLYGIVFASITWSICIYLTSNLKNRETVTSLSHRLKNQFEFNNFFSKNPYKNSVKLKHYLNANLIKPVSKVQENFTNINEFGLVKNEEDAFIREEGYKLHAYNIFISNQLSFNRTIPDTRNELCNTLKYSKELPTASIVICFYNEHFQTLLRSIHSIINRTPKEFLKEVILVDDYSDLLNLNKKIINYIKNKFDSKVKLFKTEKREGLIRARIFGARKSSGDVLIFLDSHIEVNVDWIQPLLQRIKDNRKNVVTPIIDIINADTFVYSSSPLVRGGFNWGLHFKWENLPKGTLLKKEDFIKPIKSPTMAGGLYAINREYFEEMGEYDEGMNIWGGENLEISFRIWMCGGNLEMIPCSRVGHVFRQRRPYSAPDGQDTMLYNSLRVANVWMDDYKDFFLKHRSDARKIEFGDITSRLELRKRLKCNDFNWYLKHVYPELALPSDDDARIKKKWAALETDKFQPWHSRKRNYIDKFHIRLHNTSFCVQSAKDIKTKSGELILGHCTISKRQTWYETDRGEFVLAQLLCLQATGAKPILYKCHEMGGDQEWSHRDKQAPIYNLAAGTCLGVDDIQIGANVVMKLCSDKKKTTWDIVGL